MSSAQLLALPPPINRRSEFTLNDVLILLNSSSVNNPKFNSWFFQLNSIHSLSPHHYPKRHKHISAFIVPMDTPGFFLGAKEDKLGIHASSTTNLIMDSISIPSTNLLGAKGEGFKISMKTLDGGRIGVADPVLGIAFVSIDCVV